MRQTKWMNGLMLVFVIGLTSCYAQNTNEMKDVKVQKTEAEWREILTPQQYNVLRESGTERPHTGEYDLHFEDGVYSCAGCGTDLFKSDDKFDAHCGWPSFDKAIENDAVVEIVDRSHGMSRTEIRCATCGGHLGHVFNDGPTDTGLRYCINSTSLGFDTEEEGDTKAKE
jgi:peptide-methionine (R)-S-oxide reductase